MKKRSAIFDDVADDLRRGIEYPRQFGGRLIPAAFADHLPFFRREILGPLHRCPTLIKRAISNPAMTLSGSQIAAMRMRVSTIAQAACSGRLRDALAASSSSRAKPAFDRSIHRSAGMLSRWLHERTVVTGLPVSAAM